METDGIIKTYIRHKTINLLKSHIYIYIYIYIYIHNAYIYIYIYIYSKNEAFRH